MVKCRVQHSVTTLQHSRLYPLLKNLMPRHANFTCTDNCSGHGECYEGTCFCEVQYSGGTCTDPNLSYFVAFSTIFYLICAVSFIQLLICIRSEFNRIKPPSVLKAFKVTTQKALYALICVATFARGFYFSSPENASLEWASSLMSAYYPLLLTGSSLIVCFWAEVFHLRDLRHDIPRFLSKSFLGFLAFNIITYSLLMAELVLIQFAGYEEPERVLFLSVFNGSFAVLMVIVVVFFLIYGVEVFFKVRGAFVAGPPSLPDMSQVHQSRLGLVAFAVLLLSMVLFILSDVMGSFWKDKVPVLSRNCHDVMFRVIEMGLALWFPCVLWNCVQPQQLWILNPKRLLVRREAEKAPPNGAESEALFSVPKELIKSGESLSEKAPECFICYDTERTDAGPLIRPCNCKGDVSVVHHDCLRTWLVESAGSSDSNRCKVCNEEYELERGDVWLPSGLSATHWAQTAAVLVIIGISISAACVVVNVFDNVGVRTLAVGLALLAVYVCLRLLGVSVLEAYHRAKFSAVKILGRHLTGQNVVIVGSSTPSSNSATVVVNKVMTHRIASHLPPDQKAMLTTMLSDSQHPDSELAI
ncbi:uncharacterized protein LOC135368428 [Ornithodoros turicata]|uniref:Putative the ring-variant domain is a c4hc3 zinc-finger like motif found in a number of cellular n=1 Tax=Ornithodoros turicata TaxID=34597 RepID=A0A2R5LDK3_9ACAR